MCDCLKTIEDKTLEALKELEQGEVTGGKLIHSHFPLVENTIKARITYSEFRYSLSRKKKDGTFEKAKNKTASISHSYCPFCGEKHS